MIDFIIITSNKLKQRIIHMSAYLILCFAIAGLVPLSYAQTVSVVAVVDGEAITNLDLENRLNYLLVTTGLQLTDDNEAQLRSDVLNMLIDDKLKIKEATRFAPSMISAGRTTATQLVNDNYRTDTLSSGQNLNQLGLDRSTIEEKYLADVVWATLLRDKFKAQFENSANLAEQALERVKRDISQPQVKISEIVLAPSPDRTASDNMIIGQQMVDAIRNGADFGAIARQYSAAGSANNGGRLGWLVTNTLPEDLQDALAQVGSGEVIDPINQDGVIYILRKDGVRAQGLIDPSQTKVTIARALLPLPADVSRADQLKAAGEIQSRTEAINNCEMMEALNTEYGSGQASYLRNLEIGSITPNLREILEQLSDNTPSEPLIFAEGMVVFMICERIAPQVDLPSLQELERAELNKMFSILSNRFLLRLRRAATIEIR